VKDDDLVRPNSDVRADGRGAGPAWPRGLLVDHPDFSLDQIAARTRPMLDTKGAPRGYSFNGEML
jgi:hypothetical protein